MATDHSPAAQAAASLHQTAPLASGRVISWSDQYLRLAKRLAEDLGIDPAPAITQLHEAILRHDPSLDGHRHQGGSATKARSVPAGGCQRTIGIS